MGHSASGSSAVQFEYRTNPFGQCDRDDVSGVRVLQIEYDSTVCAGGGLSEIRNLSETWFAEASLVAGYYDAGSGGVDLGGDWHFRTLIGFGYRLSDRARVSLPIDHLSNAGIESENPGRETVAIR